LDARVLLALSLFLAVSQVDGGLIDGVAVMVVALAITNPALISGYGRPGHSLDSEPPDTWLRRYVLHCRDYTI